MKDKLSIIKQRIKESKKSRQAIADKLGIERSTTYNWTNNPDISKEEIALLGYAIDCDFSIDFPEIKGYHFYFNDRPMVVGEPAIGYGKKTAPELEQLVKVRLDKQDKQIEQLNNKFAILNDTVIRFIKSMQ